MDRALGTFLSQALESDPGDEPADDARTQAILDAALVEISLHGPQAFPLESVARRAGVNRTTLYRRYRSREGLTAVLASREGGRLLERLLLATAHTQDPADRLVHAFAEAVEFVRDHPMIRWARTFDPGSLVDAAQGDGARLIRLATDLLTVEVREAQRAGAMTHLDPAHAAETVTRIFGTFLVFPISPTIDTTDGDRLRDYARHTLVPMLFGPAEAEPSPTGPDTAGTGAAGARGLTHGLTPAG